MASLDHEELLEALRKHFPDGVDIFLAESTHLTEASRDLDPRTEEGFIITNLDLTEIEPESMIYAAMSPITHRVYVFIDPSDFLNL